MQTILDRKWIKESGKVLISGGEMDVSAALVYLKCSKRRVRDLIDVLKSSGHFEEQVIVRHLKAPRASAGVPVDVFDGFCTVFQVLPQREIIPLAPRPDP